MSVLVLENDRLYSKEIGAELLRMTELPPIQAGREVLLMTLDMEGKPEYHIPRLELLRDLERGSRRLAIEQPWSYCWIVADTQDQGVVVDWGKQHHKLEYYIGNAEYILHRVTDYDSEKLPLHAGHCLARIDELRAEVENLRLDRQRFHEVDSILVRAQTNLGLMLERWRSFEMAFIEQFGSSRVDSLAAERGMQYCEQAVAIHLRSVYLGRVRVGREHVLLHTPKPSTLVTYGGLEADISFKFEAPITGIKSGMQPEGAVAIKRTRGTNQDQTMYLNPAPFGIRSTRAFSSANDVSIFLADPPSDMCIGDINEAKAS